MLDQSQFEICEWGSTSWLFFSENIWGDFIYYSHLFPSLTGLIVALFVFRYSTDSKTAQALLFVTTAFTAWSLIDLFLWASDRPDLIMFAWSSLIYFDLLVYVGSFYFVYAYITEGRPGIWQEIVIFALFIPLFLFAHTELNLLAYDFTNCWREAIEGPLWQWYVYIVEILIALAILVLVILNYHIVPKTKRVELVLVTTGVLLFLALFSLGNILGSIETDWEIGQIGLFGMPILVCFLAYTIVRYEAFKVKILTAEVLFIGTFILLLSILFVRTIENKQVIAMVTLVLFTVLGYLLIRNVRQEVNQREQIERLAVKLEKANVRLKEIDKLKSEFVSIASHQLRSPVTAIRGYASLLLENSYGHMPEAAKDPLTRIEESAKLIATSIEDYLNVSRIEGGNMKYNLSDFSLRDEVEHICDDLRPIALKSGLVLLFRSDIKSRSVVHADIGKTQQIIHNLINNAIKYTKQGSIVVHLKDDTRAKKITVDITDTGIGMNEHTMHTIFQKFERAENANSVNVSGTGLGLYVALQMAKAMEGYITAHSDGDGRGSRFSLTLPLVM